MIEEETDRLSQLVTEAVQMSEIDAGKVTLERVAVAAGELVRMAASTFAGRGGERLEIGAAADGEPLVFVDRDIAVLGLRQIIDNALKYAAPPSTVRCVVERQGERVIIRVIDHGIGVPERHRERIFDKFYRRSSVKGRVPGSGLGLHIAREIARMHGGDLWVEAGHVAGSEFCFTLPAYRAGDDTA